MAENDSLRGLQGLHRDLLALSESKLPVVQRLWTQLENRLQEFKALLDKPSKNDKSRQTLSSGKIFIGGEEYEINEEFKQQTLEIADALNLDELESAALFLAAQEEAQELDRTTVITAIIGFHKRREFLLECVRLIIKLYLDYTETDSEARIGFMNAVHEIFGISEENFANASGYWQKCFSSMGDIEKWLQHLAERIQSAQVLGQAHSSDLMEIVNIQRRSLTRQHESLSAICSYMVKPGFASVECFKSLLAKLKSLERHDVITIHYVPMVMGLVAYVSADEGHCSLKEARSLHQAIVSSRDNDTWALRNFQAATLVWWLAEYSGRYTDQIHGPELANVNLKEEAEARSAAFGQALSDGAFHFMLSFSQDIRPNNWYDPAKTGLVSFLLQDATVLPSESIQPEEYFQLLVMEQLQQFVDAFITNMPDTLRKLKVEEDEQRKLLHSRFQHSSVEYELHLERFLIIIAYAFDGFPEAAQDFWADKDGNLYGFLQWAAKRQPTPRIAAFCEMLRSLSTGDECSEAAHQFLLEEGATATGKIRRTSSLSYNHIFNELWEFAKNIAEPKKTIQGALYPTPQNPADQIVEPESAMMLESYLRLLAHLSRQSALARHWILSYDLNAVGIFFQLCSDKVESRLRASAIDAVAALLTNKSIPLANGIWDALDTWAASGSIVGAKQSNVPSSSRHDVWDTLSAGYDESNASINLLRSLVEPYPDESGLNDTLPFPESLGSSHRMPGIETYVDFVVGRIFGSKCSELQDPLQLYVMRSNCLSFIVSCLATFNEDLVIFANKSNIPVDSIIDSSSLAAYVRLHPFARVMEWLFNDNVLKALFAASHHDILEVDSTPTNSPLISSLMLSIEVMDLVMKLQTTYLDIVRPMIKLQTSLHRSPVANTALASFEDVILNNLQIVVDLGLYCGTGHEALTISSLQLLEKLSSSRKLITPPTTGFSQRSSRSKIVGILEKDNESERIAHSLVSLMQIDEMEQEAGLEAPGFIVKMKILEFLNSCLEAVSTRPTIAHLLLGFSCGSSSVQIVDGSLWENGNSLFHAILKLAVQYPQTDDRTFVSWKSSLKRQCWDILKKLWSSPLTSPIVMNELRNNDLLFIQALDLPLIDANTPWDTVSLSDAAEAAKENIDKRLQFYYMESAVALQNFLQQRSAFYDYISRELRTTVQEGMPTLRSRIQSTLLGITVFPGSDQTPNPTIFDLFDFIELEICDSGALPAHQLTDGFDFDMCKQEKHGVQLYELSLVEQVFILRIKEMKASGALNDPAVEEKLQLQAKTLLLWFLASNQISTLLRDQKEDLRAWVQLVTITIQSCDFDSATKTAFVLQTLQVILPKLENSYTDNLSTAMELAGLGETLIQKLDFESTSFEKTRTGDFANDRLSQLFRAALMGIFSPVTTPELREYCYQISYRYLQGTSKRTSKDSALGRHTLRTVKNCGEHLIEVITDDAYAGQGTCKVSALLVLDAFVALAKRQESKYVLDGFIKLNFVAVLVDNIKQIPTELRAAAASNVPVLLSYYDASLALLLRICQSQPGAAHVVNAGLFQSIHDSQIFSADPDIGLEFENPDALKKYFELMLAVLRVINTAVLSRGEKNEQTIFQAREFLKENRHSMVAIFKRNINVGGLQDSSADLNDLVDCFTLLAHYTGFLEYEEKSTLRKASPNLFS